MEETGFRPGKIPHFQEAGRINPVHPDARMPDEAYGIALDHLVFACVDIIFTCQREILLAKRNRYPRPSWWIVGGRMAAGEDPKQTAMRKAAQEANLQDLAASRFQCIGVYSTCFSLRQQKPEHHGSHSLNVTYQIELTAAERQQLALQSSEYDHWCWVDRDRVEELLNPKDEFDAFLLRVLQDLPSPSSAANCPGLDRST